MSYAILYARFSPRPDADECDSCEKQKERMQAWCKAMGHEYFDYYADPDASGASTKGRPELERAVSHACRIHGVLVVYDLSRLSRNTSDALEIKDRLEKSNAGLASVIEQFDTSNPVGEFVFTVLVAKATMERKLAAQRTSKAMLHHQAAGRRMGRADRVPYGWTVDPEDDKRLVEDEDEQKALRIIQEYAEDPVDEIAERLDMDCLSSNCKARPRNGQPWNTRTGRALIRSILAREAAK